MSLVLVHSNGVRTAEGDNSDGAVHGYTDAYQYADIVNELLEDTESETDQPELPHWTLLNGHNKVVTGTASQCLAWIAVFV